MNQKHISVKDINPDNWHLYVEKPDENFSPEHNRAVIQETLDEAEKLRKGVSDKTRAASENVGDILASFAKYKLDLGGGKQIEQYLGKKRMAEIYGEKLVEKLRLIEAAKKLKQI